MLVNLSSITMPKPNEELLTNKFLTKEKFAEHIEIMVRDNDISYIDAIVEYCEKNSIEIETVGKLISKPLKDKIKFEATELNFLKKTSFARLPF